MDATNDFLVTNSTGQHLATLEDNVGEEGYSEGTEGFILADTPQSYLDQVNQTSDSSRGYAFCASLYDNPDSMDQSLCEYMGKHRITPEWELALKVTLYTLVIISSLVGNLLIIFVVWKNKRMRTTTNYYLVNLAIADLLVTSMCSWVHVVDDVTENWVLGAFFCKFNSFAQGKIFTGTYYL